MRTVVAELIDLLSLEAAGDHEWIGHSQDLGFPKVFGGQVIGQGLSAASYTVDDRVPHSLHAYFLRAGDVNQPIHYAVEVIRDGGSFSARRVVASQYDKPMLVMTVSFQKPETGLSFARSMPSVPGPEKLQSELSLYREHAEEIPERVRAQFTAERPVEFRIVENQNPFRPRVGVPRRHMWIRSTAPLPDDLSVHRSMLAYTSDYGFLETALQPHGVSIMQPDLQIASLDHSIWFHREFRLDDWLLYVAESPITDHARGFVRGEIFNQDGELVASTAQEGLMRLRERKA
ncbi:acyl-CoA thioesterase II [Natronospirillum operosum]|uniref:Acyl-CoA thioesterase 2 n=1 Tax=Natronospirillum operosum TaxID=2759953 RepID=A0A4Z0WG63_9GAMM|nr:acyl-CoA thioesterase domain-containing protein [Natronospirillum operosum]TGG94947.1 acyl-CoA thioesterase II [Natronospirillum operosum]